MTQEENDKFSEIVFLTDFQVGCRAHLCWITVVFFDNSSSFFLPVWVAGKLALPSFLKIQTHPRGFLFARFRTFWENRPQEEADQDQLKNTPSSLFKTKATLLWSFVLGSTARPDPVDPHKRRDHKDPCYPGA